MRATFTVTWVLVLSLRMFYQGLWFYSSSSLQPNALLRASAVLRTVEPLWFASFFSSLAFGLAWYAFSFRRTVSRSDPVHCGLHRRARVQVFSSLCIGICVFALNQRIVPLMPMLTDGQHRSAAVLLRLEWGEFNLGVHLPVLELQVLVGLLAAALVALQVWDFPPRIGGSRRSFAVLAGGLLERIPSPVPRDIFELDTRSPVLRGLLFDDLDHRDEAELALETYVVTHSSRGRAASTTTPFLQCELCLLPQAAVWTLVGLPLLLADTQPSDRGPSAVVEIPRGGSSGRVYDPRHRQVMETLAIEDLSSRVRPADWIVLVLDDDAE